MRIRMLSILAFAVSVSALDLDRAPKNISTADAERLAHIANLWKNDPLLAPERQAVTQDLVDKIGEISRQLIQAIYEEMNAAESERLLTKFRENVELMIIGIDNDDWRSRLSSETGSLDRVCDLARFISNLKASSGLNAVSDSYRDGLEKLKPRCSRGEKWKS